MKNKIFTSVQPDEADGIVQQPVKSSDSDTQPTHTHIASKCSVGNIAYTRRRKEFLQWCRFISTLFERQKSFWVGSSQRPFPPSATTTTKTLPKSMKFESFSLPWSMEPRPVRHHNSMCNTPLLSQTPARRCPSANTRHTPSRKGGPHTVLSL
jgi:hypothetical protein